MSVARDLERQQLPAAAVDLAAQGFRVFPCHTTAGGACSCGRQCGSPGKHPRTPNGFKDATVDVDIITAWWRRWPESNIGVATGGGLVVIDVDGDDAHSALDQLAAENTTLPNTRAVSTGRDGGRHLWFQVAPEAPAIPNSSGRVAKDIDVRGEGGYVLAPPSLHASGRSYTWEQPDAPVATLPAWLAERMTALSTAAKPPAAPTLPAGPDPRRVAALGDAVLARELQSLTEHSTEPGSGRGTALFGAAGRLGRIVAAGGLDLGEVWQALDAAGQRLGLDQSEIDRSVERGLQHGLAQTLELPDRHRTPSPPKQSPHRVEAQDEWPELTSSVDAFPLEALPGRIAEFVAAVATETQTPADLAAICVLAVLSAAALGSAVVAVDASWEEELGLYLLAVMDSGDRKSSVLRSVMAPLRALERERYAEASVTVRERRRRKEVLQSRKSKLVSKAGQEDNTAERLTIEEELAEVDAELEEMGEPEMPRLLADDATPEALSGLIARHGRIAILSAEAAVVDNLIGRYDSSNSANLHLVCKAWAGEEIWVDRRNREAEHLDRPLLTIMLVVQPHVLQGLVGHRTARAQGLVGRFAYAMPESLVGRRDTQPPTVPASLHQDWDQVVRGIATSVQTLAQRTQTTADALTEPTQEGSVGSVSTLGVGILRLSLSPSAKNLLRRRRASQEPRLAEEGDLHAIKDWIARDAGRIVRIAGLLHLACRPRDAVIGEDTLRRAVLIGDYLLAQARAALNTPDELTRRAMRWLRRQEVETVTQRDLHRGPLGGRGHAEDAEQLAAALVEQNAIRRLRDEASKAPGRPASPTYAIHPALRESR